jgi:hypothetical protein
MLLRLSNLFVQALFDDFDTVIFTPTVCGMILLFALIQFSLFLLSALGASSQVIGFGIFLSFLYIFTALADYTTRQTDRDRAQQTRDDLDLLGSVRFGSPSDRHEEWSCSICLSDSVGENEMLCELNVCKHVFHRDCIDNWFLAKLSNCRLKEPPTNRLSQLSCPLCRTAAF